ncbi:hypothetical protein HOO54_11120 [Bacillus sp. WMMC1349]|uniref:helix-turn-helix domain-containing protein n=1 Tax=Bacillus sp. WMMC1349 TaxID=2736254 RepID=UPI001551E38A|nr:helix-turn-helix domain-containing protein [Bacillus sp. WMMC1349]NPC92764.1 hypothetical protein [Bacillus sp. WMMC1349]
MAIQYIDAIVLDILSSMQGERSPSAVYHLLKGKKSSQTIQDTRLFSLSKYFGFCSSLSRDRLNSSFQRLIQESFITEKRGYIPTESGEKELTAYFRLYPWPAHFHGAHYQRTAKIMWDRMSLLIQVLSNHLHGKQVYLPITKDGQIQNWVKKFLKKRDPAEISAHFHHELKTKLMALHDERQATIFVHSLTSAVKIGLTFKQLAERLGVDEWYIYVLFWDVLHYFIQSVQKSESPFFQLLIEGLPLQDGLTKSTKETLFLIKQGKTIDRIAQIRHLKRATIEDHIVEIAIHDPAFSIEPYISEEEQKTITDYARINQTRKIRLIKEGLGSRYSYFKIRLALSKAVV